MTEFLHVFTNEITLEEMLDKKTSIAMAPTIFQERVEAGYEVRVTVVGEEIFAIRIDNISNVDWRTNYEKIVFSGLIEIPKKIKQKLLAFQEKFKILYGAYDFIVTPEGDFVFLECNPCGQWYFNEEMGEAVAIEMAKLLVSNTKCPSGANIN